MGIDYLSVRRVKFFNTDVIREVDGECFVVINGWIVREYLQTIITVWFRKPPPYNVRRVVPANAFVVQRTCASAAKKRAVRRVYGYPLTSCPDQRLGRTGDCVNRVACR